MGAGGLGQVAQQQVVPSLPAQVGPALLTPLGPLPCAFSSCTGKSGFEGTERSPQDGLEVRQSDLRGAPTQEERSPRGLKQIPHSSSCFLTLFDTHCLALCLVCASSVSFASSPDPHVSQMTPVPEQPPGHTEGPPESAPWPPLPCGPCIPIMLALASFAALFLLTTAVLAERLFRRSLRPDPSKRAPTLVWRPGGELWIEPTGSPRERSEDWYGSAVPLLTDQALEPPNPGGTLEARATAPPNPCTPMAPHCAPSSLAPKTPPQVPARSTFWVPQPWEERPQARGLVSWAEPGPRPEASGYLGNPPAWRPRPGSPEPDWGLQPRVTLEQISAFWRREGRTSVGF
ncbi:LOW QUALITY PROTEIN: transmembrane protein C16orf54 homolog [Choloepus didactylus]|uniref:LOW QUALITY PROTEIN: transmembrane protein C16orf54 homolog n=1 Tax=Choloepus didactylus TaxID=27675 RepID=UPI00189C9F1E|nr:LOW QUALITY PROTEIN: transmembrane protein C16orf54 homolog [Choloepus didactylus]